MSFADQVYLLTQQIPAGQVSTYKEIARALDTKAYQAVGQVLKRNPQAPVVPCHRVVKTDGSIGGYGGFTAGPRLQEKIKLLSQEGVRIKNGRVVNFSQVLYHFNH